MIDIFSRHSSYNILERQLNNMKHTRSSSNDSLCNLARGSQLRFHLSSKGQHPTLQPNCVHPYVLQFLFTSFKH